MLLLHNHLQRHDIQSCCMFPGLEHMNKCKLEPNSTAAFEALITFLLSLFLVSCRNRTLISFWNSLILIRGTLCHFTNLRISGLLEQVLYNE
ncbi:hypothetical protein ACET3Z_005193 [Daucus carota]